MKTTSEKSRPQIKHLVLWIVACVLLAGCLIILGMAAELGTASVEPVEPEDSQLPDGGLVGSLLVGLAYGMAHLFLLVGFALCWGGGQVISALLAMERGNKPRWLWMASLVLALVYLAILLITVGIWLLV